MMVVVLRHARWLSSLVLATSMLPASAAARSAPQPATSCQPLLSLSSIDYSILSARIVRKNGVPEHCRVLGVIRPEIRFIVNLPTDWNGRFLMIGGGGWAGFPPEDPFVLPRQEGAVRQGFATGYTDSGHNRYLEQGATFAYNNLQAEVDFGFRAVHLTAVIAREIINVYYGQPAEYSYFLGCSTGGRQALVSAQRFPSDFDGIVAGAPVHDFTGLLLKLRQAVEALEKIQMTPARLEVLSAAVYERCDGLDGLVDSVIDDPRQCHFDPTRDLPRCDGENTNRCFTAPQMEGLRELYGPLIVNGVRIHPGIPLGAEIKGRAPVALAGATLASGWNPRLMSTRDVNLYGQIIPAGRPMMEQRLIDWLRYVAFEEDDPERTWRDFDIARDLPKLSLTRSIMDAVDPDLTPLANAGGKLIVYHGWSDTGANPLRTAEYFDEVYETMGAPGRDTARLFMVPGMFHCGGGTNVDRIDPMTSIIEWVETDTAPDSLIASRVENGKVTRTRPIYAYPNVARYKGEGSTDEARNFKSVSSKR